MGKTRMMVFAIAAILGMSGCASGRTSTFPPRQNAVYVSREGRFYTALTESYDPADTGYEEAELQAMAAEEAAEYNEEYGSEQSPEPVTVEGCTVSEGTASVIYGYASARDLCQFTQASQDTVNHPEILGVAGDFSDLSKEEIPKDWTDARKKEAVSLEKVMKKKNLPIVVVGGAVTVQTEGKILYYSGNVQLKDEFTAQISEGTAYIMFR